MARVVDGDTLLLDDGTKLRLVGVNTPERGEPLYAEAAEALAALIGGRPVRWIHDREERDAYGRELAYVFTHDGRFLNGEVVRRGLAYCYAWEPNTRYAAALLDLQHAARADGFGLWGLPAPEPCEAYVSDARSHVFHRLDCRGVRKIAPSRRLTWSTRTEALDTGRNPCRNCRP